MPIIHKPRRVEVRTRTTTDFAKVKREFRKKVRSCKKCYALPRNWKNNYREHLRETDWFVVSKSGQCVCPDCHDGNYEMAMRSFETSAVSKKNERI